MESINQNGLEKADMSKHPKVTIPESSEDKDMRKIRFRFVTAEMLEKYRKMSEEAEMFKRQYEEAAFKVYGTVPAGKSSFKMQSEYTEEKYCKMSEEAEMFKRQYEHVYEEAAFKVYGTVPAEKSSFKMQGENIEKHNENHGNG